MATTFVNLQTEFFARGYDYLNTTAGLVRSKRWLNQSYSYLCSRADFRWLYEDATAVGAMTIPDLRKVLSVTDVTNDTRLMPKPRDELLRTYGDLTTTGTAWAYFVDSETALRVYPVDTTSTLNVRYVRKPPVLVADADVVLTPDEGIDLIVDGAVLRAKKDNDDYDDLRALYMEDLREYIVSETIEKNDPDFIYLTGASSDW